MQKKLHPRYKRVSRDLLNDWHQDLMYRREAWVFRRLYGYWATPDQMRALHTALARYFNVPEPKLILRLGKDDKTGGWFKVYPSGAHHISIRGSRATGVWNIKALSNRCKHYDVATRVREGEYHVHSLLHEWAHYLVFVWFGRGGHSPLFAAVDEVVHAWYARRRKRETRREVWWKLDDVQE